jgi:hypothetical protein
MVQSSCAHRDTFGVESVCCVLRIGPSMYPASSGRIRRGDLCVRGVKTPCARRFSASGTPNQQVLG